MRRLLLAVTLLAVSASPALARDAQTVDVQAPRAPAAVFVDGVKVGSELAALPKQAPVRSGSCSSCTIVVTY